MPAARPLTGTFWHQGAARLAALHLVHPARYAARFRRVGGPGTWYASSSEAAAWAELMRHAPELPPADIRPRRVARVHTSGLRVLDLTDPAILAVLALTPDDLTSDDGDVLAVLANVAAWAEAEGFQGLLAPSAAAAGEQTLVLFASGLRTVTVVEERIGDPPT